MDQQYLDLEKIISFSGKSYLRSLSWKLLTVTSVVQKSATMGLGILNMSLAKPSCGGSVLKNPAVTVRAV